MKVTRENEEGETVASEIGIDLKEEGRFDILPVYEI